MLRGAPWLYEGIYRTFFRPPAWASRARPGVTPLTGFAEKPLLAEVEAFGADEVLSTFHIAAQVTGRLRQRGRLRVPSTVMVVDFAVHDLWLQPGNDAYWCLHPSAVADVHRRTGRPTELIAPLVDPAFRSHRAGAHAALRTELGLPSDATVVAITTGSWGTGRVVETTRTIARTGRYIPVALCGRNDRLRRSLTRSGIGVSLGWRDDMPEVLAGCDAIIENAGGLTCLEALAVGVPVVNYQAIPGHGRDCARAFEHAGLTLNPGTPPDLLTTLDAVTSRQGTLRRQLFAAAQDLFTAPLLPSGAAPATPAEPGFLRVINGESPCEQISDVPEAHRTEAHPAQEVAR
jgi:UDP-N-acetylglucosamine:LPS N-acetylglucosamine transferase